MAKTGRKGGKSVDGGMTGWIVEWMNPCSRAVSKSSQRRVFSFSCKTHSSRLTVHTEKKSGQNCQQWIREQRTLHKTQVSVGLFSIWAYFYSGVKCNFEQHSDRTCRMHALYGRSHTYT